VFIPKYHQKLNYIMSLNLVRLMRDLGLHSRNSKKFSKSFKQRNEGFFWYFRRLFCLHCEARLRGYGYMPGVSLQLSSLCPPCAAAQGLFSLSIFGIHDQETVGK
jgi:hypothetical protein